MFRVAPGPPIWQCCPEFRRRVHLLTGLPFTAVISAHEAVAGFADPNFILLLGDAGPHPILATRFAITVVPWLYPLR